VHAIPSWSTNIQLRILAIVKRKLPQLHEQKPKHASSTGRIVLWTRVGQYTIELDCFSANTKDRYAEVSLLQVWTFPTHNA
jgi:hypothetical protein